MARRRPRNPAPTRNDPPIMRVVTGAIAVVGTGVLVYYALRLSAAMER